MPSPLARLHRLRPELGGQSPYIGRRSGARIDPEARAAVDLALRHIEIHADLFPRREVIAAALRVASPEVTVFRLAADLQRLIVSKVGVLADSDRRDGGGPMLTSSRALEINAAIVLEIDAALGRSVFLMKRREALARLSVDGGRHVVLVPDRPAMRDLAAHAGVEAILAGAWIEDMDRVLADLEDPEPLWRSWSGRTLLVDRAWTLPNVDVLLILELCRRLCLDLVLADDAGRFPVEAVPKDLIYSRTMPRLPKRRSISGSR